MSLDFIKIATNTVSCAGVAYAGKIGLDFVSSVLAGRQYTLATNMNNFAFIGGAFYLAKLVSDAAFNHFITEGDKTEHQISKTLIAAQLTTLALAPFNIVVGFSTALYSLPVYVVGTHIADKLSGLIHSQAPATK